jgi:hypothetical protein
MSVIVTEIYNVNKKLAELECNIPTRLAFLPFNLENVENKEELVHENSVKALRTLFRNNNIEETPIEKVGDKFYYRQQNAFEWLVPTIFVSYSVLSENPNLLSLGLSVIANYATDIFKGIVGDKSVKLNIIVEDEKKQKHTKIEYQGSPEGMKEITNILKSIK